MSLRLNINRINLTLHDVPEQIVEEAVAGLQGELMSRVGSLRSALNVTASPLTIDVAELAIGPLQQSAHLDSASLRGLLADQLMNHLHEQITSTGSM